jgi:copper transport protein
VAVVREAVALALVFAAAAVLLSGQPATEPQLVNVADVQVVPLLSARVGDLQETMAIRPNVPGRSVLLVQTLDTRRPSPGPVTSVVVTVGASGRPVAAEAIADGGWSAPITLDSNQPVDVTVVVTRTGGAALSHTYRWVVGGGPVAVRRVLVSTAPLHMPLQTLAAGIAGALLALAVGGVLARRRRKPVATSPQDVPGPTDPGVPADGQVTVG